VATLVLALDRQTEDRLLADIVEQGHSIMARLSTARDLVAAIHQRPPEAVIVGADGATLTAEVIAACDARGVRVIALAGSGHERRHAVSLGLHEVVDAASEWAEIEALLGAGILVPLRVGDRTGGAGALAAGSVIAVWGPAGAPGRTTLAINIAAEIAAAGHTVALADVDTYSGSVAPPGRFGQPQQGRA
jgi:Mrp family chromosome partitioning ATPase